jgi:hypothetical protein
LSGLQEIGGLVWRLPEIFSEIAFFKVWFAASFLKDRKSFLLVFLENFLKKKRDLAD